MARALRIQFEGAYYHVASRGNERRPIFSDDPDRKSFLELLERSLQLYDVRLLCYVLMSNHFHLVVQTLRPNLSEFMRHFNISYTSAFNRRHRRSGHLYQGRYHATVVERESYLLEVSRYLHLNPSRVKAVKAKGASHADRVLAGYPWSSYPGYVSVRRRKPFVDCSDVLEFFGGDTARGRRRYAEFVREGIRSAPENPFREAVSQVLLGGEEFVERLKKQFLLVEESARERPAVRQMMSATDPEQALRLAAKLFGVETDALRARGKMTAQRGMAMELLHRFCALSQAEIGKLFGGLDYSTVSLNRKQFLLALDNDKKLRQLYLKALEKLKIQD